MTNRTTHLSISLILCALVCNLNANEKKVEQDATRVLGTAEALARNLRGVDKAYAFLLVARAYSSFNAAEESRLLEESCKAAVTAPAEDLDVSFKEKIEYDCLQRLLVVRPAPAAELLSLAGANVRQQIMARKAPETAKKGDMDAAMEMLSSEISKGAEYPYDRAMAVLKALPPDDRADRDRIFAQALSLYRERHKRASAGMEDLGTMIVRFWRDLSPGLVLEGVNQLLDSAMDENVADSHLEVTVSLQSSAHSFGSLYQYRLFQLLPVLHALDPSSAARLMHDNQQPEWQHKVAPHDPMLSMTLSRKNGPAPVNSVANQDFAAIRLRMRAEEILASVKDDPALALARALSLDGDIDQGRSIKADVLTEIARITLKEHSEIASKSLEELSRAIESYPAIVRCRYLAESGNLYWRMQKTDKVRSVVAQGMKLVNALYKEDSNSDDPNRALKSAWPSTVISRAFASLASRVSLKFAEETIAEVGDSDIQVFDRIEIASTLLAASSYPCLMQERHKQQNTYSMQVFAMPSTSN